MPRCPCCNVPMTRVELDGIRVNSCPDCFGSWVNPTALLRLTRQPTPPAPTDPSLPELAALVVESANHLKLRCPECTSSMLVKERLHPMIPLDIDRCHRCKSAWLDVGKLPLLRRLYHELQNSTDPRVIALRDKVAGINLDQTNAAEASHNTVQNVAFAAYTLSSFIEILTGM